MVINARHVVSKLSAVAFKSTVLNEKSLGRKVNK